MLKSFLKLLSGEQNDEIIWTADLEYWVAGRVQDGNLPKKYKGEIGRLELSRDIGILPYYWYDNFWLAQPLYDGVEVVTVKNNSEIITRWTTKLGHIEKKTVFAEKSCSWACTKHPVSNEQELKILRYILGHRRLIPASLDNYEHRRNLYAKYDGLPAIAMPRSPLPALAVEWCGIENLVYLMMDCKDLIKEILELFYEQEKSIIEAVCMHSPVLVHFADNLTSELYTSFFDEYMEKYYKYRLNAYHNAGVKCAVHLDGSVRGLLSKLSTIGFDAIEALTPSPAGDATVEEMAEMTKNDNVILWGGMPGAMFCEPYTWQDIETHLEKLFNCWKNRKFVLGVADQVPANGNIEICKKISTMIRDIKI